MKVKSMLSFKGRLSKYLSDNEIATGLHYPVPLHLQECFKSLGYKKGDFPETEKLADNCLSLPMFAELTDDQQIIVATAVHEVFMSLPPHLSKCFLFPVNEELQYTVDLEGVV